MGTGAVRAASRFSSATWAAKALNGAQVLFIVDGAELGEVASFERCLVLFDGRDDAAVALAREQWKAVKASGADASYWRQNEEGTWSRAA